MTKESSTMFDRYCVLVETIGKLHKAGDLEATADLDALEPLIIKAFGVFKEDAEDRIHSMISHYSLENGSDEETTARQQKLAERRAKREAENAAAREAINALCRKYHTSPVFPSDANAETVAAELAHHISQQLNA